MVKNTYKSKKYSNFIFNCIKIETQKNERKKEKKNSKPEHSSFIQDIPTISLHLPPTTPSTDGQGLLYFSK
jgi:hypothetical protein